jgi:hypothetical protein
MIAVKIECGCGQRYAFDVEPVGHAMARPVYCPVCGADGTTAANQVIANSLIPQPSALRFQTAASSAHPTTLTRFPGNGTRSPAARTRNGQTHGRKWIGRVIGASMLLLLGLASLGYVQRSRIHREASAPRVAGFPQTLSELNAWYVEPPAGQNAATIYLQAFNALQIGNGSKVPLLGKGTMPAPTAALPSAEKSAMTAVLRANSQALLLLAQGKNYEESRYPVDFTRGFEAVFPHLPKIRSAALLLELASVLHGEAHQGREAANDVLAVLALGRSLAHEPSLGSQSVRVASISIAMASWEQTLNRTEVPKDSLTDVIQAFRKLEACEAHGDGFDRGLAAERVNWIALLENPTKLMEALTVPGVTIPDEEREQTFARLQKGDALKTEQAQLEQVFTQFMDARNQSFPGRLKADECIQQQMNEAAARKLTVLGVLLTSLAGQSAKEAGSLARLRLGMVSAALEQFRMDHGAYPDALSSLVPEYLPGPVLDPFDGEPIRYRKDETGIILRSAGLQPNDNNSVQKRAQNEKEILFAIRRHAS